MNVLIACEESQRVCIEFRKLGHRAFSCDVLECSGGHPEWHIQGDALKIINGRCEFVTMDGKKHRIDGRWNLLIAHPPCTYLTVSGNRWFNVKRYGEKAVRRSIDREMAVAFFMKFVNADCNKIAIENPICIMSTRYRKPDQIIQPYQFGHPYTKQTCLWLKGLPKLIPTNIIEEPTNGWLNKHITKNGRYSGYGGKWGCRKDGKWLKYGDPEVKKTRSKTFPGIAEAMATQWSNV